MVGQLTLDQSTVVRIHVPEPKYTTHWPLSSASGFFVPYESWSDYLRWASRPLRGTNKVAGLFPRGGALRVAPWEAGSRPSRSKLAISSTNPARQSHHPSRSVLSAVVPDREPQ